jgi:hypothetical protein
MFSAQINEAPPAITLLNVSERERRDLRQPESTAWQDGQYRPIANSFYGCDIWSAKEGLRRSLR